MVFKQGGAEKFGAFISVPNILQICNPITSCSKMRSSSGMRTWVLIWNSLDLACYVQAGVLLQDKDADFSILPLTLS